MLGEGKAGNRCRFQNLHGCVRQRQLCVSPSTLISEMIVGYETLRNQHCEL